MGVETQRHQEGACGGIGRLLTRAKAHSPQLREGCGHPLGHSCERNSRGSCLVTHERHLTVPNLG